MGVIHWSRTPNENATIDPDIYWAEGQAASTLNDSARATMAALKEWHDDTLGTLTATKGGGNDYALTTAQSVLNLNAPFEVAFQVSAANTGPATLRVDGTAARPIQLLNRDVLAGELVPGIIYRAIYNPAGQVYGLAHFDAYSRTASDARYAAAVTGVPAGAVQAFATQAAPAGWLICDGSAVSRTAYPALFTALGTIWGAGDGTSTFNLPNLVNEFVRGAGPGRAVGTREADDIKSHAHGVTDPGHGHGVNDPGHGHGVNDPGHTHPYTDFFHGTLSGNRYTAGGGGAGDVSANRTTAGSGTGISIQGNGTGVTVQSNGTGVTIQTTGGAETRPRNVALLYCIKT